jgi:hypothetical protein
VNILKICELNKLANNYSTTPRSLFATASSVKRSSLRTPRRI